MKTDKLPEIRSLKIFGGNKIKSQFDEWISDHHAVLYKHAFWMTGNPDNAMDAVQETFYQAWLSIDKLQDTDKVLPWLITILRRAVYREQRYQYRQVEVLTQLSLMETELPTSDAYSLVAIYDMLDKLSIQHREVFLLFYLHGFSYEEIAKLLEIPAGTVMSRLARARAALQKLDQSNENKVIKLTDIKRGQNSES